MAVFGPHLVQMRGKYVARPSELSPVRWVWAADPEHRAKQSACPMLASGGQHLLSTSGRSRACFLTEYGLNIDDSQRELAIFRPYSSENRQGPSPVGDHEGGPEAAWHRGIISLDADQGSVARVMLPRSQADRDRAPQPYLNIVEDPSPDPEDKWQGQGWEVPWDLTFMTLATCNQGPGRVRNPSETIREVPRQPGDRIWTQYGRFPTEIGHIQAIFVLQADRDRAP